MKTLLEVLTLSSHYLKEKGVERPRFQAEELLAEILKIKRIDLYLQFERPLLEEELKAYRELIKRKSKKEPLQYIRGSVDFLDTTIKVNRDVLIPRHETEILAEKIANKLKTVNLEGKILWDICCGSGCLAIALKKKFPQLNVKAVDISPAALKIAVENAEANNVNVDFYLSDLFEVFSGQKADFIVSNPPYIAEDVFPDLEEEVRLYEPKIALVSGPTGFEFYERFAAHLGEYINQNGLLFLEIGSEQGSHINKIFQMNGWNKSIIEKDWAGHERFFFLECCPESRL